MFVLVDHDISQGQLKATASDFFLTFYGERKTDSMNTARYKMYMSRPKEATAAKEAATERQQPATTRVPSPYPNYALEGSSSEASTSRRS